MMQPTVIELQGRGPAVDRQSVVTTAKGTESRSGEGFSDTLRQQETDLQNRPKSAGPHESEHRPAVSADGDPNPGSDSSGVGEAMENGNDLPVVTTGFAVPLPDLPDPSAVGNSIHAVAGSVPLMETSAGSLDLLEPAVAQTVSPAALMDARPKVADGHSAGSESRRETSLQSLFTASGSGPGTAAATTEQLPEPGLKTTADKVMIGQQVTPGDPPSLRGPTPAPAEAQASHFATQLTAANPPGPLRETAQNVLQSGMGAMTVDTPVVDSRWGAAVAQRVSLAVQQGMQYAQIQLNPAHLGPIDVQIQLHEEGAAVTMLSAQAPVRDLLEGATQRLRDLLDQQGIALQQYDVSDHPGNRQPGGETARGDAHLSSGSDRSAIDDQSQVDEEPGERLDTVSRTEAGLIDRYV